MKIKATLLKFGEDSRPDWFGDVVSFQPGSLFTDDHQAVPLLISHYDRDGGAAGKALSIWTEGDTVQGEFELLDTPAGRQAAIELAAGVRWDVSVGVLLEDYSSDDIEDAPDSYWGPPQRVSVASADLFEVSLCLRGRMPSARVDEVHESEGVPA